MPQTYIRAVGPGSVARTSPVAVSCSRSGEPGARERREHRGGPGVHGGDPTGDAVRTAATGWPASPRPGRQVDVASSSRSTRRRAAAPRPGEQLARASCRARRRGRPPSRAQHLDSRRRAAAPRPSPTARCAACLRVEGHAVVDAVHRCRRGSAQHVTALAVGVVEHGVEHAPSGAVGRRRRARARPAGRRTRARRGPAASPSGSALGATTSTSRSGSPSTGLDSTAAPCRARTGPSRSTVGGTTSQPVASDTAYAATSRPASVPSGKSHSGRSPRDRLVDAGRRRRRRGSISQNSVALDASTSRPSTLEIAPRRAARGLVGRADGSTGRCHGTRGVSGGSRWPAGRCDPAGSSGWPQNGHGGRPAATTAMRPLDEGARQRAGEPHPQQRRAVLGVRLELGGPRPRPPSARVRLDDDAARSSPSHASAIGADPELLLDRGVQRVEVVAVDGGDRGDRRVAADRRTTSSSSASTRSARTCTCCFSSATLVDPGPARACRKNMRSPGSPTVPATNRSGGSKSKQLSRQRSSL